MCEWNKVILLREIGYFAGFYFEVLEGVWRGPSGLYGGPYLDQMLEINRATIGGYLVTSPGYIWVKRGGKLTDNGWGQLCGVWVVALRCEYRWSGGLCQKGWLWPLVINTLRPRQNGRHFPDDIFKSIFLNENVWISIEISLKFVPRGEINNIPALVQKIAWCRPGDKPLSEPMMVRLPTHICVTRPQWVNT